VHAKNAIFGSANTARSDWTDGFGGAGTPDPVKYSMLVGQDPIVVQVTMLGTAKVIPGSTALPTSLDLRVAAGVVVTPTAPAFVRGLPIVPDYWAKTDSSMVATLGSGHVEVIPDPDPIIGGNPHPGGVTPAATWHSTDLTSPTSPYGLTDWPPHGGSGPHWLSTSAYAPVVRSTVVYGPGNKYHTYAKGVHFDGADVRHMWMDWGSSISQPFSFILCGIIHNYPTRTYGHYLLDAGVNPTSQIANYTGADKKIDDGQNHRNVMLYQSHNAILATHQGADAVRNGKHVITRADFAPRPKMFFGIFNGSSSYIGAWDNRNKYIKKGSVDVKTHRYFITGRRQNNVSDNLAAHMTVFEMRMFTSALGTTALNEIYKQLAATWKFNLYHV
jgi:hypothetical protein